MGKGSRCSGVSNRSELRVELNTAKRLTKIAGGKPSATIGLSDVQAIDPEGITASYPTLFFDPFGIMTLILPGLTELLCSV